MPYCRNCGSQFQEADIFCETCRKTREGALPKVGFIGKTCPFCQFPLKAESSVAVCSDCKMPHHRECWEQGGGCTTFGCRGTKFSSTHSSRGALAKMITVALLLLLIVSAVLVGQTYLAANDAGSTEDGLNIRGNSTGNIINWGLVARQGDWIYYHNDSDEGKLYRVSSNGDDKMLVSRDQ